MKTCAVADCGISGGTKRDPESRLNFCTFHLNWYGSRAARRPALELHDRRRYDDLRVMRAAP